MPGSRLNNIIDDSDVGGDDDDDNDDEALMKDLKCGLYVWLKQQAGFNKEMLACF